MFSNAKKLVWLSEEVAQHKVRGRHQASDTEGQKIQNTKAQTPLRTKATAVNIALINFLGCVTVLIVSLPTGSGLHNSLPFRDSDWWCWHSVESLLIYPAPSGEIPSSCGLKTINYIGNTQDQRQALKNPIDWLFRIYSPSLSIKPLVWIFPPVSGHPCNTDRRYSQLGGSDQRPPIGH